MRLKDKTAIVTGAGSGFGEGIARRFSEEGARVLVADINQAAGRRVGGEIEGGEFFKVDVSDGDQVKAMVRKAKAAFGGLNIPVNNAGIAQRRQPMLEVKEKDFERIYAVNVKSIYLSAIHALPLLKKQPGGGVINTASTAAISPRPGLTWYNGSKGAVWTLTKSMAVELAPEGIRVNAINPVIGETGLTEDFMGGDTPELREKFIATIPWALGIKPPESRRASGRVK